LPYSNRLSTKVQIQRTWSGGGWVRGDTLYPFRARAPRQRWDMWRYATPLSDFHKFHNAQRTKLKPHEPMRKMLSDQKPAQSFGARTSLGARRLRNDDAMAASRPVNRARDEVQVAPPSIIERKGEQTIGMAPVDTSADVVKVTPPPAVERKGEQTIGMAPVAASADVVRVTPPPAVEHNGGSITRSLEQVVSLAMIMVLVALTFITLQLRHRYAERILAYAAMRRSEAPADCVPPVKLLAPPQIEADPNALSSLEMSVKKVLVTIKEAEAEIVSSRQLRA
jgi:hypothetical protein